MWINTHYSVIISKVTIAAIAFLWYWECAGAAGSLLSRVEPSSSKDVKYLLEMLEDQEQQSSSSTSNSDESDYGANKGFEISSPNNHKMALVHPSPILSPNPLPHPTQISNQKSRARLHAKRDESGPSVMKFDSSGFEQSEYDDKDPEGYLSDSPTGHESNNDHDDDDHFIEELKPASEFSHQPGESSNSALVPTATGKESQEPGSGKNGNGTEKLVEQQEKLLLQKLMVGYERDVRPVKNASQAVLVRVGITLTQIFDMNEKEQVLTSIIWLDQEWYDEMLHWDPAEFGGLTVIRIPCERLWLPDIVLYNNADDYTRGYMPSRAMVSFDGNVFWPPPSKLRSTCVVDVTYFPFDDQVCRIKLGSWTYNGEVDVTNRTSAVDLSNYIPNGEWELVKATQQRNVVYYSCCPEPFPDVTITLVIRRKALYYIYNIVLPCMMLSALTLLVFCLPPDSGEKIALGITVLLAFSVFMLAINESLPETSESIPLIGVYLTIVMAITSVSVIMTVVVLNLHYLGPEVRPVPRWLLCLLPKNRRKSEIRQRSLFIPANHREPRSGSLKRGHIFISRWRGAGRKEEGYSIEVPSEKLEETTTAPRRDITVDGGESLGNCSVARRRFEPPAASSFQPDMTQQTRQEESGPGPVFLKQDHSSMDVFEELLLSIKHLINKQEEVEVQNNLVAEWRLVAQVVDRILFWLFFIFTLSSSAMILLVLPIYKRSWYGSPLVVINDTDVIES